MCAGRRSLLLIAILGVFGCAQVRSGTTRLRADDFVDLARQISSQLEASGVFANRSATDDPWVITMARVQNLSSDFIPESEQWYLMEKLRVAQPMRELSQNRSVRFVIPAEYLESIKSRGDEMENFAKDRAPTHRMDARIRSVDRVGSGGRTDLYQVDFDLIDLSLGEVVWSGSGQIKRMAFGRVWD